MTLRAAVKAAINEIAPEGLLTNGAPSDEYDPEIDDFVSRIRNGDALTGETVTSIWARWFDHGSTAAQRAEVMSRLAARLAEIAADARFRGA